MNPRTFGTYLGVATEPDRLLIKQAMFGGGTNYGGPQARPAFGRNPGKVIPPGYEEPEDFDPRKNLRVIKDPHKAVSLGGKIMNGVGNVLNGAGRGEANIASAIGQQAGKITAPLSPILKPISQYGKLESAMNLVDNPHAAVSRFDNSVNGKGFWRTAWNTVKDPLTATASLVNTGVNALTGQPLITPNATNSLGLPVGANPSQTADAVRNMSVQGTTNSTIQPPTRNPGMLAIGRGRTTNPNQPAPAVAGPAVAGPAPTPKAPTMQIASAPPASNAPKPAAGPTANSGLPKTPLTAYAGPHPSTVKSSHSKIMNPRTFGTYLGIKSASASSFAAIPNHMVNVVSQSRPMAAAAGAMAGESLASPSWIHRLWPHNAGKLLQAVGKPLIQSFKKDISENSGQYNPSVVAGVSPTIDDQYLARRVMQKEGSLSDRLSMAGANVKDKAGFNALAGGATGLGIGLSRVMQKGTKNMSAAEIALHLLGLPAAGVGIGSSTGALFSGARGMIDPEGVRKELTEKHDRQKADLVKGDPMTEKSARVLGTYLGIKSAADMTPEMSHLQENITKLQDQHVSPWSAAAAGAFSPITAAIHGGVGGNSGAAWREGLSSLAGGMLGTALGGRLKSPLIGMLTGNAAGANLGARWGNSATDATMHPLMRRFNALASAHQAGPSTGAESGLWDRIKNVFSPATAPAV